SEDIPKVLQSALGAPGSRPSEPVWRHQKKDGTVFPAKVLSWEITFDGHQAALVLAEAVRAASAQNWPGTQGRKLKSRCVSGQPNSGSELPKADRSGAPSA